MYSKGKSQSYSFRNYVIFFTRLKPFLFGSRFQVINALRSTGLAIVYLISFLIFLYYQVEGAYNLSFLGVDYSIVNSNISNFLKLHSLSLSIFVFIISVAHYMLVLNICQRRGKILLVIEDSIESMGNGKIEGNLLEDPKDEFNDIYKSLNRLRSSYQLSGSKIVNYSKTKAMK